jgi:hypothetical protein
MIAKNDGGVSTISALRCIWLRLTLRSHHQTKYSRIELKLFSPPTRISTFYQSIKNGVHPMAVMRSPILNRGHLKGPSYFFMKIYRFSI